MCGIVGCVGKIYKQEEEAFKLLLQLDTIRGPDSTGVVSVTGDKGKWEYTKSVGTPWDLFAHESWTGLMRRSHRVLLGHNRRATNGAVNSDNAHPFAHGDFVGVHNGTLTSRNGLSDSHKFPVDSENIYYNMSVEGIEATIEKLQGAFALVWYNAKDGLLQMVRNKERPLFVCKAQDNKTFFWASEAWMLRVALGKHNIKFFDPVEIDVGKLISFEVPSYDVSDKAMENFLPRIKEVKLYSPPPVTHHYYDYSRNYAQQYSQNSENREVKRDNVVPFFEKGGLGSKVLRDYIGKTVVFSVAGLKNTHKMEYILCEVEDELSPDIRIFVTPKTTLGKLLLNSTKPFKARVKAFTNKREFGCYLTVDHRSITETEFTDKYIPIGNENKDDDDSDEEIRLPVLNDRLVSVNEWYRLTNQGCAWCAEYPRIGNADKLKWFGSNQFVCDECAQDPSVVEILR